MTSWKQNLATAFKGTGTAILGGGIITNLVDMPKWFTIGLVVTGVVFMIAGTFLSYLFQNAQSKEVCDVKQQTVVNAVKIANVENKINQ